MSIAYKFIRESFTSQVTLNEPQLKLEVQYIDGPFKYLENDWEFKDIGKFKSEIYFDIDYEFKSRTLGLLMGNMFELVFSKLTRAFEKRADEIYKQT